MENKKELIENETTVNENEELKTQKDLFKVPELPEDDTITKNTAPIVINGKKRYILKSGKLGSWNDVVAEKKRIAKRRAKNKVARKTRRQQRIIKLRRKNG